MIAARGVMGSAVASGYLYLDGHIEIVDSYGATLAAIPFAEALTIQP